MAVYFLIFQILRLYHPVIFNQIKRLHQHYFIINNFPNWQVNKLYKHKQWGGIIMKGEV